MGSIEHELTSVIRRFAKTLKKHGVKKVVAVLDELNSEDSFIKKNKSLINFIIKETTLSFNVSKQDLQRKNIRGVAVDARSMCFVLIKIHLDLKHKDIASLFGSNNHSLVSNALKTHRNLDNSINYEKSIINKFEIINDKVKDFKTLSSLKIQ